MAYVVIIVKLESASSFCTELQSDAL
uniref:Uncharacterized protein n=1 Tax=Anguilla anguilla TaxID=7936 RepID=A0A0E9TIM1_ANGAN